MPDQWYLYALKRCDVERNKLISDKRQTFEKIFAYESIFGLVGEFPVIFQYGAEYIVAIFRGKFNRIQFLVFFYGEHKLIGYLRAQKQLIENSMHYIHIYI